MKRKGKYFERERNYRKRKASIEGKTRESKERGGRREDRGEKEERDLGKYKKWKTKRKKGVG